jgi:hypothetical protein
MANLGKYRNVPVYSGKMSLYSAIFRDIPAYSAIFRDIPAFRVFTTPVAEWLNANKLSLNTTKTKVILFRSSNKKPKQDIKININGNNIEQVRNTVFLGIVIDECLTWKDHIAKVAKKLIRAAGIIAKIRHFVNRNTVKLIYYVLVYPYLIYGNLTWGNTYKNRIQTIMNIQKKIVRLMAFKSYFDHSEPIFKDLNILNIFKINDYLTALFMFLYHHLNNLPEFFKDYFVTDLPTLWHEHE